MARGGGDAHPIRQLFRYYGSKKRMAPAIASLVPPGTTLLLSLFVGSGAFEYNYANDHPECRVVCYDKDPAVVNFHRQALRARLALHAAIMAMHAKVVGTTGGVLGKDLYRRLLQEHRAAPNHSGLLAAAKFYLLAAYSFSGRFGSYGSKDRFREPSALLNALPTNIEVHTGDALKILLSINDGKLFPTQEHICMYLDPPYHVSGIRYYTHHSFDHVALASLLLGIHHSKSWILSYNDAPPVFDLYRGKKEIFSIRLPVKYKYNLNGLRATTQTKYEMLITNQPLTATARRAVLSSFRAA